MTEDFAIYYQQIIRIEKSRDAIASSANSLDRLNIVTEQKDFYISLQNNDLFISQIRKFKRELQYK
ncbi:MULTISPECIES: PH domain-containing protein [Thomasclavelia]|uniref:PH domain-containing protein n=1 Tax=Thomasclavelia TaxID=3025755 RepID=UPI0009FD1F36|nr:PH domain-containing protein [Thomasclavelia ramosa]MBV3166834.1 PH domain-containing protein [Erysipelatoclostridium sp. MSK.23.68]MBV3181253.1 PH domain-containing protein [Erysipelatoclostridium sp. MSK.23.67]MBV3245556.1 PH domain-containing protein [Erysipelatoclostridium sp. MSK.23.31]MDU1916285.1 PH domain-containing protein [Coprobacillus sp.]